MNKKTTVLMILDGYGLSDNIKGNAIKMAKKPNLDKIMDKYPWAKGNASGLFVGLPDGQMGNSEVGHLNMGAGRIVYQELTRITKAIDDGDFYQNPQLLSAIENCKENNSALHIFGLLSDGGVHSHITHLYAVLKLAKDNGIDKVFAHTFLDGRDVAPSSAKGFLQDLEDKMKEIGVGKIATVCGRFYAMDRDNRWERVEKAYQAMVEGKGEYFVSSLDCINAAYDSDVTDEFVVPGVMVDENKNPIGTIDSKDSIIFSNFRPDRAREITRAIVDEDFNGFKRGKVLEDIKFVCFTEYDITIKNKLVAFKPQSLKNTLGEYISSLGLKQLRLAETEKYAHVTFFFNGGVEQPNELEDRILVPSPKVATYDLKPEMSAVELTQILVEKLETNEYDLIIVNYANPDMVGHTGNVEAAIKAVETVDLCVGKVYETLINMQGQMFICADHGNSDKLIDLETNQPFTAHTTNPVPFVLVNYADGIGLKQGGTLADVAPTLLDMMNIEKPEEMSGVSLLVGQ